MNKIFSSTKIEKWAINSPKFSQLSATFEKRKTDLGTSLRVVRLDFLASRGKA